MSQKPQRFTREQLGVKNKDTVVLQGTLAYSRLANRIEGDELAQLDAERTKKGQYPVGKAYYTATLTDVDIVVGKGTPLGNFMQQEFYTNKDGKQAVQLISKAQFPINVWIESTDPALNPAPVTLEKDLKAGQTVKILIAAFSVARYSRLSSAMDGLLLAPGPVQYYESAANAKLAGFGYNPATPSAVAPSTNVPPVAAQPGVQTGFVDPGFPGPVVDPNAGVAPTFTNTVDPNAGFVNPNPVDPNAAAAAAAATSFPGMVNPANTVNPGAVDNPFAPK